MTIEEILHIRQTAYDDLVAGSPALRASEWGQDRFRDILWANRQLRKRGAIPASCATE
jgi:hypothetical protein